MRIFVWLRRQLRSNRRPSLRCKAPTGERSLSGFEGWIRAYRQRLDSGRGQGRDS
jgi:hypothetical protein